MQSLIQHSLLKFLAGAGLALLCAAGPLRAGFADGTSPGDDPNPVFIPEADRKVSVNEHLGNLLPLDAWFTDETGKGVQLKDYFSSGRKPVILQIGYFRCPQLCGYVSKGLVDALKDVRLNAGPDYQVIFLSIDPKETPELAMAKKESFLKSYARDGSADGWHLLTGNKQQIDRVADAAGVEYRWVAQAQQYSHPAVVVLATPQGKVSRYLYFGQKLDGRTLRLSLVEASDEKIGNTTDQFMLTCFQFDGRQGKYAVAAIGLMKLGGLATILVLGGVFLRLKLREHRHGDVKLNKVD